MARTKSNISQEILNKLLFLDSIAISSESARFWPQLFEALFGKQKIDKRKVKDAFYYLRKQSLITGKIINGQLHIVLTSAGKKEAGRYKLAGLKINSGKAWDKKWRLLILDPSSKSKVLLRKIKELGFYPLKKNIWLMPFACAKEIAALREFFGLNPKDLMLIQTNNLEGMGEFKKIFNLL